MKILHTADLHLGAKNSKLPLQKQRIMKEEELVLLQKLFEKAKQDNFDALIIAGDLFHSKNVSRKLEKFFFDCVTNFEKPVIYVPGNHDEKFDLNLAAANFIILDENNPKYEIDNAVFWSVNASELLLKTMDTNKQNILVAHGDIYNSSSRDYLDLNKILSENRFDYIALGHVHSFKKESIAGCTVCYPGSLFSNGFDEVGDKGYLEVNLSNHKVTINFIAFAKRRYQIKECDITGLNSFSSFKDAINKALEDCGDGDLIRIILTGYFDENTDKLLSSLEASYANFFYFEIQDNSKLKIDFDKIRNEKLSFKAEFLTIVEQSNESEEDKNKIMQLGIEALKGDDLSI